MTEAVLKSSGVVMVMRERGCLHDLYVRGYRGKKTDIPVKWDVEKYHLGDLGCH